MDYRVYCSNNLKILLLNESNAKINTLLKSLNKVLVKSHEITILNMTITSNQSKQNTNEGSKILSKSLIKPFHNT